MKKLFIIPFIFLLMACSSSKQYYEPKNYEKIKKSKIKKEKLPKEYKDYEIINTQDNLTIISNDDGFLKILKDKEIVFNKKFDAKITSIDIQGNKAVMVDVLNNIIIFDLLEQRLLFSQNFGKANGTIKKLANPKISDQISIVPTLDGKLIIINNNTNTPAKSINVGTQDFFNNIIYFKTYDDRLVAASSSKIFTLHKNIPYQKINNIKTVVDDEEYIYIFNSNGEIIKYNYALEELTKTKYKYAIYNLAYLYNDYLYVLEYGGYMIKLDTELNEIAVYKLGSKIKYGAEFKEGILFYDNKSYELK